MNADLLVALNQFKSPRVLVVGDVMLDRYVHSQADRISPEAPVPVLVFDHEEYRLGGAANVAANLQAMGAKVTLAAVVGLGSSGLMEDLCKAQGIDPAFVISEDRPTTTKTRFMCQGRQVARMDREHTRPLLPLVEEQLGRSLIELLSKRVDMVVLSDYGKGTLTHGIIAAAINNCRQTIASPKTGDDLGAYWGAKMIMVNQKELTALGGVEAITRRTCCSTILTTMGAAGIEAHHLSNPPLIYPAFGGSAVDVIGAGDTALAMAALAFNAGFHYSACARLANIAAGLKVQKVGASTVTLKEIRTAIEGKERGPGKIQTLHALTAILANCNNLVFTNGCFDGLHAGHETTLRFAKSQGDVLVVGLNSDKSVRRLKGKGKPVHNQTARARLLAALEVVDYVTIFDEDTPKDVIRILQPHVVVKGADYVGKDVVAGGLHNAKVLLARFEPGDPKYRQKKR
jgi:D-beta-D-heptose 7-phosphate kinase/D-beta-D-heptose 1-phosphate adenosyltransferase